MSLSYKEFVIILKLIIIIYIMKTNGNLIIGIGNPILTDDAVGLFVLRSLKESLLKTENNNICYKENHSGGIDLLEDFIGYKRLMVIDSFISDTHEPGHCLQFTIKSQPVNNQYNNLILSHGLNLQVLWELGTKLELAMPDACMVIGIVISDCINFNEKLSDKLALSFSKIMNIIKQKTKNWFALNTLPDSN